MARLAVLSLLASMAIGAASAGARAETETAVEPPLYPEIILETDASFSNDPELSAFRLALADAAGYQWGKPLVPEAVVPFLADDVEFLVGQKGTGFREEFVSLGHHPAGRVLEMAGRMSRGSDSDDPVVHGRYGMQVLADLVAEPTVGPTPWLDGRVCTASYGRISWPDWIALDGKLRFLDRERWTIASVVARHGIEGLTRADWPKRFQMVPVSQTQKRSGGSLGIVSPEGGVVFFRVFYGPDESYFAPYLNSHACFEKGAAGWKVTAIALRLD